MEMTGTSRSGVRDVWAAEGEGAVGLAPEGEAGVARLGLLGLEGGGEKGAGTLG